jgi:uncharacterized protein DUF5994
MVQVARPVSKPARLALCDRSLIPGAVDGAWWPSSPNLRSELPDLVAVIGLSIGQVRRVVYDPSMWPDPPSRIIRGTMITAVDPYTLVARDTIYLMGTHSRNALLYVVPPAVPGAVVHRVLRAVSSQTPSMCVSVLRQLVKHFAAEAGQPQVQ